jgi:hypothetical protein
MDVFVDDDDFFLQELFVKIDHDHFQFHQTVD